MYPSGGRPKQACGASQVTSSAAQWVHYIHINYYNLWHRHRSHGPALDPLQPTACGSIALAASQPASTPTGRPPKNQPKLGKSSNLMHDNFVHSLSYPSPQKNIRNSKTIFVEGPFSCRGGACLPVCMGVCMPARYTAAILLLYCCYTTNHCHTTAILQPNTYYSLGLGLGLPAFLGVALGSLGSRAGWQARHHHGGGRPRPL